MLSAIYGPLTGESASDKDHLKDCSLGYSLHFDMNLVSKNFYSCHQHEGRLLRISIYFNLTVRPSGPSVFHARTFRFPGEFVRTIFYIRQKDPPRSREVCKC